MHACTVSWSLPFSTINDRVNCSHVPNEGEQRARYYGYYSNVSRGKRKKAGIDDKIPGILKTELSNLPAGKAGPG